jgi:hypothetical protein
MLSQLRQLQSLSIDRGSFGLMGPKELGLALQSLSSTVKELNLTCLEADTCWLLRPPHISHFRENAACVTVSMPSGSRLWPVANHFSKLETLRIVSPDFLRPSLLPQDMPFLPTSLTCLEISKITNLLLTAPEALPRNLLHFKHLNPFVFAHSRSHETGSLHLLPPELISYAPISQSWTPSKQCLASLPMSIRRLPGAVINWNDNEIVEALASNLQQLEVSLTDLKNISPDIFTQKLANLTHLTWVESPINAEILRMLPATLTYLQIPALDWTSLKSKTDFPNQLKTLECMDRGPTEKYFPTPTSIMLVPDSLSSLAISVQKQSEFYVSLPPSLTCMIGFAVENERPMWQWDKRYCHFPVLSNQLHTLQIDMIWRIHRPKVYKSASPQTMAALTNQKMPSIFPETLRYLTLGGWYNPVTSVLPKGLLSFDAGQTGFVAEDLEQLPESLTSLKFLKLASSVTAKVLYLLPRNLRILHISRVGGDIYPDCFKGLPDSLREFAWDTTRPHKPSSLLLLPPNLVKLWMHLENVADGDMKLLPRSLSHVQLGIAEMGTTLTTGAAIFMPSRLDEHSRILNWIRDPIMNAYNRLRQRDPLFSSLVTEIPHPKGPHKGPQKGPQEGNQKEHQAGPRRSKPSPTHTPRTSKKPTSSPAKATSSRSPNLQHSAMSQYQSSIRSR